MNPIDVGDRRQLLIDKRLIAHSTGVDMTVNPPVRMEQIDLAPPPGMLHGAGEAWVEVQEPTGRPLAGYAMDDAVSVDLNGISQEVWWKKGSDMGALAGRPICLRIKMRSAKLYAFQFGSRW